MSAARIDALIFDLDDTLIDWWGSIERCLAEFAGDDVIRALQEHCRRSCWERHPDGAHVWHRNTWALHHHRHRLWPEALPFLDPADRDQLLRRFEEELWVAFFPDAVPALDALVDEVDLAVLSNNQGVLAEAARLRLDDWFRLTSCPPPGALKPDPTAFLTVAEALGVPASRCAYVGDSIRTDVLGALGAGMVPIWIDRWGDDWPDPPADVVRISSLAELPAILESTVAS